MDRKKIWTGAAALLCAAVLSAEAFATVIIDPVGGYTPETEAEAEFGQSSADYIADNRPDDWSADDSVIIADGVTVSGVAIGGMTPTEAKDALTEHFEYIASSAFTMTDGDQTYSTSLKELGYTYDLGTIVEDAAYAGQYGTLIHRYKVRKDILAGELDTEVPYAIDRTQVEDYVTGKIAVNDREPVNADIKLEDGSFVVSPSSDGHETDVEATVETVVSAVEENAAANMSVAVTSSVVRPYKTTEALDAIHDRLGTYSTEYSSSASGRKKNIKVASGNINGTLLMPGDSFSTSDAMKPRSPENGYELATEYLEGNNVEAYGGGVCQVATTLYNAVLRAELQIDRRYNHSMLVSYVDPSKDAAIAAGSKDLVFTNNLDYPIYIAASCDGATLRFSIYGKETRPENRTLKFRSVVLERVKSTDKIIKDPNLPEGKTVKSGHNHDKCRSYLVKEIYIDGELQDTVQFKTDEYMASVRTVRVGTKPAETLPAESSSAAVGETGTAAAGEKPTKAETKAAETKADKKNDKKKADQESPQNDAAAE